MAARTKDREHGQPPDPPTATAPADMERHRRPDRLGPGELGRGPVVRVELSDQRAGFDA